MGGPFRKVLGIILVFTMGTGAFLFSSNHQIKAATGTIWYAKPAATGSGDCTSWADACTLQEALTNSSMVSDDEIWVMMGTHVPTTNPLDRTASFFLVDGVAVYGGFNGTETDLSQRNIEANLTILSGDIDGDDSQNPVTDIYSISGITTNSYSVVSSISGVGAAAVMDGFTITGGYADGQGDYEAGGGINIKDSNPTLKNLDVTGNFSSSGGGIFAYNSNGSVLDHITIRNNLSYYGGGMLNKNSTPILTDVAFTANFGMVAGGMYNFSNSDAILTNVTFEENETYDSGGGMVNETSSPTLKNVTFLKNYADDAGGGMFNVTNSNPDLTDVIFENNETVYAGGGMSNYDASSPSLTNVTFVDNFSDYDGGGMDNEADCNPILVNVTFKNNTAQYGGGINNYDQSSPQLTDVTFINNQAMFGGGGANDESSNPVMEHVVFDTNTADEDGGGIWNNNSSNPTLTDVTFKNNTAEYGGGIANDNGSAPVMESVVFDNNTADEDGGGIWNNTSSNPTLTDVTFKNNRADDSGGGIKNYDLSSPLLTDVTFINNQATVGGGIANDSGCDPVIENVVFDTNTADNDGGGIWNNNFSNPTLTNVTFKNNQANASGGGMYNLTSSDPVLNNVTFYNNRAAYDGGAIQNYSDSYPTLSNVTITGNQALYGGAISNGDYSYATLNNVTISGNTATGEGGGILNSENGYSLVYNSIIWGNSALTGPNFYQDGTHGISTITDSVVQGGFAPGNHIITDDPMLDTLADNHGFTKTIALMDGSSAIDAGGVHHDCEATDQRGINRPVGASCDIGAYEFGADILAISTSDPQHTDHISDLSTLSVTFNEAPVVDGSARAANYLDNYLLVGQGENGKFDTTSCAEGIQTDDVALLFSGVSYEASSLSATLTLATPLISPENDGHYRLFVCGTTSIWSAAGLELNNGESDTTIDFFISEDVADDPTEPDPTETDPTETDLTESQLPETGFTQGMITILPAQPTEKAYADSDLVLKIPDLGVEMDIVGVPLVEGEWDTSWLGARAGWLEESAFPTWAGNSILTGHVWDANNNPGPFADLKNLQYGDQIIIIGWNQTYVYEVRESSLVFPSKVDKVFQHEEYDYLTLLTCEMYNPLGGNYVFRRIVRAVLVEIQ